HRPSTQRSRVHWSPSSQARGSPTHLASALQTSPRVHGSPSSQAAPCVRSCLHSPETGSQESLVHGLPSSQLTGVPAQKGAVTPCGQRSSVVQGLPSSHAAPNRLV